MRLSLRGTKNWASTPPKHKRVEPGPPMSNAEFRRLCTQLKINDNETAAELFGISWRTCQRYWYDEISAPEPLARLLRLAASRKLGHDDLRMLKERL
jgi:hypothetical protein